MVRKSLLTALAPWLCTAVLAAVAATAPVLAGEAGGKWLGKPVPAFTAQDAEGREISLPSLLGSSRVVIVNFWGVRCQSCLEEMPHLGAIASKLGPRGVRVLGVNADGLPGQKLLESLSAIGIAAAYPLVVDREFRIMDDFGVTVTPLTLLVTPDGKVAYEHAGFEPGDEKKLESAVLRLLEAPAR